MTGAMIPLYLVQLCKAIEAYGIHHRASHSFRAVENFGFDQITGETLPNFRQESKENVNSNYSRKDKMVNCVRQLPDVGHLNDSSVPMPTPRCAGDDGRGVIEEGNGMKERKGAEDKHPRRPKNAIPNGAQMDPATEETPDMAKSENLGLFLRIRPLLQSGVRGDRNPRFRRKSAFEPWFQKMCLRVKTSRSVTLSPPLALERGRTKTEVYDGFSQVFSPDSSQEEVYEKMMSPLVEDFLRGKSGMLAAFGPSGSGKTHTIFGCNRQPGMVPLALQQIFKETSDSTRCEGGKEERVFDLSPNGVDLTMHRSTLKGLHEVVISDWRHGEFVISQALLRRATSPTNANSQSSRSQCVINLRIVDDKSNGEVNDQANDGVLIIVDLAGAEREKRTGNQGVRLLESNFINKTSMSLLEHQKNPMKPLEKHFQDSLLTKYLRDYMEGKKRMALILTVKAGEKIITIRLIMNHQEKAFSKLCFEGLGFLNKPGTGMFAWCNLVNPCSTPWLDVLEVVDEEPSPTKRDGRYVANDRRFVESGASPPMTGTRGCLMPILADDQVAEHEIQHLRESNLELEKELKDLKSLIEVQRLADDQNMKSSTSEKSNLELEKELKDLKSLIEVHRLDDDQFVVSLGSKRVAQEIQRLRESNLELEKELKYLKSLIEVQRLADDQ
ncbi:ATP binding microtubule motor family protein, partial [Prunus dulcis]